ncbi:type IV secretory system conjugative DNA transfer family protein [Nocardioides alkalitolerans]|uniref:type IV secretory system conjugative DNA transfer family protein n=1 Tax=Nocardioides alkalitolerans TaxID=281714 RepID=UPI000411A506|nr:TraM recognition domain-containing protein [Nocardioides alkalitolerans]
MSTSKGGGRGAGRRETKALTPAQISFRAYSMLAVVVATLLGCWHAALVTTVAGVGWGDGLETIRALTRLSPVAGHRTRDASTNASGDGAGDGSVTVTLVVFGLYLAVAIAVLTYLGLRIVRRVSGAKSGAGMATRDAVRSTLGIKPVRAHAAQTRPALSTSERKRAGVEEIGLQLGELTGGGHEPVVIGFDDHLSVTAVTGAGKSVYVMVPAALSAPGALVVTSNEVSILDVIATARERKGRVWVFDPLGRTSWPEPMTWDPVAGCEDGEQALARGIAFAFGLGTNDSSTTNAGFFRTNVQIALSRMLHAAALSGASMRDVLGWAANLGTDYRIAAEILRSDERAEAGWATALEGVATGADETVASSRNTLMQAVEPLALRRVSQWVSQRPGVPVFDPDAFVRSTDTLVLISDDSSSTNVGPLCTMLFQEVVDAVKRWAPLAPFGKLDPPMRIVGDEFANIAPIEKAPEISSEVRKLGVQMVLAFQSELQAKTRWGDKRGQTLMEQMAAELVLPGLKSTSTLQRYESLSGRVEVEQHTTSYSPTQADGRARGPVRAGRVRGRNATSCAPTRSASSRTAPRCCCGATPPRSSCDSPHGSSAQTPRR